MWWEKGIKVEKQMKAVHFQLKGRGSRKMYEEWSRIQHEFWGFTKVDL